MTAALVAHHSRKPLPGAAMIWRDFPMVSDGDMVTVINHGHSRPDGQLWTRLAEAPIRPTSRLDAAFISSDLRDRGDS